MSRRELAEPADGLPTWYNRGL
ncbi:hypothetical protein VTH06DRAFT_2266 [Thermothelomyces fergusii]